MRTNRLYKDRTDKRICGVCSGIAKYLDVDPTIIRLGWLVAFFTCGCGLFAYFIAALIMPNEPVIIVE